MATLPDDENKYKFLSSASIIGLEKSNIKSLLIDSFDLLLKTLNLKLEFRLELFFEKLKYTEFFPKSSMLLSI